MWYVSHYWTGELYRDEPFLTEREAWDWINELDWNTARAALVFKA